MASKITKTPVIKYTLREFVEGLKREHQLQFDRHIAATKEINEMQNKVIFLSLVSVMGGFGYLYSHMDDRFKQVNERVDKRFEQVDKRFEQVDRRFEQVDRRFEQVDKRLAALEGDTKEIKSLLLTLINKK